MCSATDARGREVGRVSACRRRRSAAARRARRVPRGDRRDEARVQAAGEEHADGHVAHELALDGVDEHVARAAQDVRRRGGAGLGRPGMHSARRAPRARSARGRPAASTRSRAGRARRTAASRASKACISDAKRARSPRRAQYSGLIPTGSRAATKRPSSPATTNANMPLSSASAQWPALVDEVQRDLVVRAVTNWWASRRAARGPRRGCRPRRCRRATRLAVVDERLVAAVDVDDRQPPVPEPARPTPNAAVVIGSAVRKPLEHPLEFGRVGGAVLGDDPAHGDGAPARARKTPRGRRRYR